MTTRRDELLPERLRAYAMLKDADGVLAASGVSAALREAADEIEQSRAQIDGSADDEPACDDCGEHHRLYSECPAQVDSPGGAA